MNDDQARTGVNIFDYAPSTKASLCPMTAREDEWYEVELTTDTGACDTVVPKLMCPGIPITPIGAIIARDGIRSVFWRIHSHLGREAMRDVD